MSTKSESASVEFVDFLPTLFPGQVVHVHGVGKISPVDKYVVLKQKPGEVVSIAKLNGEEGKYWPSIPRRLLTVVEVEV